MATRDEGEARRERGYDVVVLGAGPAGLAAAWEVARAGRSVVVVEREAALGGLCATVERAGFRFDLGGHRIVSKRHDLVDRIRALMGDRLLERERRSVVVLGRERFSYPLVARELVERLPAGLLARAVRDYARERLRSAAGRGAAPDATFRAWVTRRFGATLYELFFGPYTEKLWGMPADELSADWAAQRISLLNLGDVGLRMAGLRRGGARTYARRYLYPRGGIGELFERLAGELRARGVAFVTEATVRALERDDAGRVTAVALATPAGGPARLACGAVISSAPLASLASWLAPGDPRVEAHGRALRHRGLRFLNVCLRGGATLGATWAYVPDPGVACTRVQEPVQRSPDMAPPGFTSLSLEVPADPGSHLWTLGDDALLARLSGELARAGVVADVRARVVDCFSAFAPRAYPVYALGYRGARDALMEVVGRAPNVWTVGRQGLFRYVFMDTAMEMGFAAARAWLAGRRADARELLAIDANPTLHEAQSVAA